jgi:hypothetical protein
MDGYYVLNWFGTRGCPFLGVEPCLNRSKVSGAPGMTRTCDLLVRSQTLYPTELRAREDYYSKVNCQRLVFRDPSFSRPNSIGVAKNGFTIVTVPNR